MSTATPAVPAPSTALPLPANPGLAALTLAAIGVVYGDIGTSPLYTMKEVFQPATGVALTPANLVGAVSAVFWALMLVVTLKYVLLVLRADNGGEGGVLALIALAAQAVSRQPRLRAALLLLGVAGATLFYGDSIITPAISVLGAMEGLSVLITTVLTWFVVRATWRLPTPLVSVVTGAFLALDALLVAGCAIKLFDGGWFALAVAALLFGLMVIWSQGRARLMATLRRDGLALQPFIASLTDPHGQDGLQRADRTAVYPVADASLVPQALLHNLKHNQVLHARNLVLTVRFAQTPWVPEAERLQIEPLGAGFWRVRLHFGFMDLPDVPRALALAAATGLVLDPMATSYFLSHETVVPPSPRSPWAWRGRLFAGLSRGAGSATQFFCLPDNAVVELGARVRI